MTSVPSSQVGRVVRLGSLLGWTRDWFPRIDLILWESRGITGSWDCRIEELRDNFLGGRPVLILSLVNHNLQGMYTKQMRVSLKILRKRKGKILQEGNS